MKTKEEIIVSNGDKELTTDLIMEMMEQYASQFMAASALPNKEEESLETFFKNNGVILTEGTVGWRQGKRGRITEGSFTINITGETDEGVVGYIHPTGRDGDTINFTVSGNDFKITAVSLSANPLPNQETKK